MVVDGNPGPGDFVSYVSDVAFVGGTIILTGCEPTHACEPRAIAFDACFDDATKLDPGACGCGHPDSDADGSGVADCRIGDELRQRIDALVALVNPLVPPKSKSERTALKQRLLEVRTAFDAVTTYYEGHPSDFAALKKSYKKARAVQKKLVRARGGTVKGARKRVLKRLAALRALVP